MAGELEPAGLPSCARSNAQALWLSPEMTTRFAAERLRLRKRARAAG